MVYKTTSYAADGTTENARWSSSTTKLVQVNPAPSDTTIVNMQVSRDDMVDFTVSTTQTQASFTAATTQAQIARYDSSGNASVTTAPAAIASGTAATALTTTVLAESSIDWVDEKDPPVKVGYDSCESAP